MMKEACITIHIRRKARRKGYEEAAGQLEEEENEGNCLPTTSLSSCHVPRDQLLGVDQNIVQLHKYEESAGAPDTDDIERSEGEKHERGADHSHETGEWKREP
eukprot:scaffold62088_cov30-Tisochrysis_lutea.AAC.5